MSYDLRFAVKNENGKFVDFKTPEQDHPTYNVGKIFRKAMDFDYDHGKYYRVSELYPHWERGLRETSLNAKAYRSLEPDNGWGSVETVRTCLESVMTCLREIIEWYGLEPDEIYFAW